jgi:hypothetical protein
MKVISADKWVADCKYLPVAHINKPLSDFSRQFDSATAFMKDGTSALLFGGKDSQCMLRELADNQTELLIPVKTAGPAPRPGMVENSLIAAMRGLNVRLPQVASLSDGLDRDRLQVVMGFGLRAKTFESRPIEP